jgi:uncharacterized membrane protein
MTPLIFAVLFWVALHLVIAGPARATLVARLGENGFRGLFSALSAVGLVALIVTYQAAPVEPFAAPLPGGRAIALALTFIAFLALALALDAGNPTIVGAEQRIAAPKAHGVFRITRHPMLWAFTLWALAHLLVNLHVASLWLFGAIALVALNGMVSIDRKRRRALGPAWDAFAAQTSRVPFAAILAGRNHLVLAELSLSRFALGLALFVAALFIHAHLFGRSSLP